MFAQLHLSMHEEAERQREPRPSKLLVTAHGGGGAGERPTELVAMWAESATGRCMKVFLAGRKTWRGTVGGGAGPGWGSVRIPQTCRDGNTVSRGRRQPHQPRPWAWPHDFTLLL